MIRLKFKTYPGKFEGDVPKYAAVVVGPFYEISATLRAYLNFNGMTEMSDGSEDTEVWCTQPSPVGPPEYLAMVLNERFGVDLAADARKVLGALKARALPKPAAPQNDMFATRVMPTWEKTVGGTNQLIVQAAGDFWYANCDEGDHEREAFLRSCGWMPFLATTDKIKAKLGTRPWRTADPFLADILKSRMTPNSLTKLSLTQKEAHRRIKVSQMTAAPSAFNVPAPDDLDYLDFQKTGIQESINRGESVLIADEMGLGKTIQGIGILNGLPNARRVLVISQANMKIGWQREIEKWQVVPRTVGQVEGSEFPDSDVVIINFDILDRHKDALRAHGWDLILIDEAQNAANVEAKRTQAIDGFDEDFQPEGTPDVPDYLKEPLPLNKGGITVQLTGTPIPSKIIQLYAIASRGAPKIFGKGPVARQAFIDRYCPQQPMLIDRYGKKVPILVNGAPRNLQELHLRLRGSFMIRRLKRNVDLPPKFRQLIEMPIRLTDRELAILKQAEADLSSIHERIAGVEFRGGPNELANVVIDTCANLGTMKASFMEISRVRKNLGILKAPYVADFLIRELEEDMELAPADRRKTICFAYHKEVIDIIKAKIEERFPGAAVVYNGTTSKKNRQAAVDDFQSDDRVRVFIGSGAAATGLTLIRSDRVRMAEMDWRPATMIQEEDRAWRIGQTKSVHVGYLAIPNSLDANLGDSVLDKMETAEAATSTIKLRKSAKRRIIEDAMHSGLDEFEHLPIERPITSSLGGPVFSAEGYNLDFLELDRITEAEDPPEVRPGSVDEEDAPSLEPA